MKLTKICLFGKFLSIFFLFLISFQSKEFRTPADDEETKALEAASQATPAAQGATPAATPAEKPAEAAVSQFIFFEK